jgi:sec-independent protein translocase protein TatB
MFDFAWSEIIVIAVVALVVIGPKDLPKALRTVGIWVGKARAIAREFQSSLDQMIRESEIEDVRKEVEKVTSINLEHEIEKTVDPGGEIKQVLSEPIISDHSVPPPTPLAAAEPIPAPPEPGVAPAAPESAVAPAPPEPAPAEPQVEAPPKSGTHA